MTTQESKKVDLANFGTDDLLSELESRGEATGDEIKDLVEEMYYAFKFGREDAALIIAKRVAQDVTGRIL